MPRTRSIAWSELKLGIVGISALALAGLMILAVGGQGGFPWQRYPLKTRFDNVEGLKTGGVVRMSGKEIGTISSIEFAGSQVEVGFEVLKDVRPLITEQSRTSIGAVSLLGEPLLDVTAAPRGTPLQDNAYVLSSPAAKSIADLTDTASKGLDQATQLIADMRAGKGTIGKLVTDQAVYNELQSVLGAADRVTKSLESTKGTAGSFINDPKAYAELTASLENLRQVTTRLNNGEGALGMLLKDQDTAASLKATTANLRGITDSLTKSDGTMGKLINERELYDKLNGVATHLDDLTQALNHGNGTLGKLVNDRGLYDNMNSAVNELKGLFSDIRKDPKKYLNVHVSIF